ncbi:MAG: branched-chain amino acid ABC transporter substrate-binding protein [Chloroflexi bacterium]|nr:branched-chain amino acid ABC transporter substrate-binding protein [Chloroflexota bacterium]
MIPASRLRLLLAPLLAAVVAGTVAAAGCTQTPQLSGEAYIYVAAPLSGDQADGGQSVVGGAAKKADEVNRAGGVLGGKKVVVKGLDDQADEDVAVEVARQVEKAVKGGQTVLGVIGHYNSGPTGAALPLYNQLGLVVITPSSSNPDLTRKGYSTFFRVCATDATQGPFAAKFLRDKGYQRIALMRTDNDYAEGLSREFKAAGVQPVIEVKQKAESLTFAKEVQQVKAANPDAIFFAGDYPDGIVTVRELRQAGVNVPVLASDANFVDDFIDQLGSAAEGVYMSTISPDPRIVATPAWFEEYQQLEARNPGIDSTTGYSAADVLLNAVKAADKADGKAIAAAIRNLDLKTLIGRAKYDTNGDLVEQKVYIFQVTDGRYRQIYPQPTS